MEISDFGIHFTTGDLNVNDDLNGNIKRKLQSFSFRFLFPLRSPVVKCISQNRIFPSESFRF